MARWWQWLFVAAFVGGLLVGQVIPTREDRLTPQDQESAKPGPSWQEIRTAREAGTPIVPPARW